jgi:hypothetical protein
MTLPQPLLLLRPGETRGRRDPLLPTIAGGVLEVGSDYGPAWRILEATTNLVTDPRVANGPSSWLTHATAVKSHLTIGVDLDIGGTLITTAARYTWNGVYNSGINGPILTFPALDATRSASLYVRASAPQTVGKTFTLGMWNGGWLGTSVSKVLTANWQRIELSFPMTAAQTTAQFLPFLSGSAAGDVVDFTAIQGEDKAYSTPYADGSMGAGHSWSGTAHASTSTRSVGYMQIANNGLLDSERGSIAIRIQDNGSGGGPANRYIFGSGSYGTTDFISLPWSTNRPRGWFRNGADPSAPQFSGGVTIPAYGSGQFVMGWDGAAVSARTDGAAGTTGTRPGALTHVEGTVLNFGSASGGSQAANVDLAAIVIFDRKLTKAEEDELFALEEWSWRSLTNRPLPEIPRAKPKPKMLLRPGASRDRDGGIVPTISGGVIDVPGQYGSAWQIAEDTKNHVVNPRLEAIAPAAYSWDTELNGIGREAPGWSSFNGGVASPAIGYHAHVLEGEGPGGENCMALPNLNSQFGHGGRYLAGSATINGMVSPTLTHGASVTISFDMKSEDISTYITAGLYRKSLASGAQTFTGSTANISNTKPGVWERRSYTFTVITDWDLSQEPRLYLYGQNGPEGRKWFANVQVEIKAFGTPCAAGSDGAGHAWTGAAYASSSTRSNAIVTIPRDVPIPKGSMLIRANMLAKNSSGTTATTIIVSRTPTTNCVYLGTGAGDRVEGAVGNTYPTVTSAGGRITPGDDFGIAMTYGDADTVRIYDTSGFLAQAAHVPLTANASSFPIGRADAYQLNGYVESVLFYEEILTEAEILEILEIPGSWDWDLLSGSPGRITNIITRSGGAFAVSTELYLADRSGRRIEKIPLNLPVEGQIQFNEDSRPTRKFSLSVNDPLRLEPFVDYLIPEVVLTDAAGNREVGSFGLYMATPPAERLTTSRYSGSLEGMDITWILDNDEIGDLVIPAGTDTGAAAREVALAAMDAAQLQLPDTGVPLLEDWQVSPGESRFQVIADLYNAANWYVPTMDGDGILVTSPWQDLSSAPAVRKYGTSEGSATIIPPAESTPDWGRLKNRIIVRNLRPNEEPIYGRAYVDDPTSPLHPDRLGGGGRPLWLSQTIDDNQVATKEEAEAKARLLLANAASWYRRLAITTLIDLKAGAHEILELDLVHQGARYQGNWLRRAWTVNLRGLSATTAVEVTRTEKWTP